MATKRKTFKLTFEMDNAAFHPDWYHEAARILATTIDRLNRGFEGGLCMDINGNKVGEWRADT